MHLRHDWREVARVFNPPAENARGLKVEGPLGVADDIIAKAVHGFTQVEYVCQRPGCEKRKVVGYVGRMPERDGAR